MKPMRISVRLFFLLMLPIFANAQTKPSDAQEVAGTVMAFGNDSFSPEQAVSAKWMFGQGLGGSANKISF